MNSLAPGTNYMKNNCESCGGTGQISYFKGVSRFLLSCEECPECGGLGFLFSPDEKVEEVEGDDGQRTCSEKKKAE